MRYIDEAFESNWVAPLGPNVDAFEKGIGGVMGKKHGAALSSGTAAIHLALKWLGVRQGDYVFCSSLTFSGSCNSIAYEKAVPAFIDSEEVSLNMSPLALEKAFEWAAEKRKLPKAVIVVNLYGQSADYEKILPVCRKYGVSVIEDAAESLGAIYLGKPSGSFGDLSIASFNGNKIITTSGGGMLLSNDEAAIKKARFWATQSRDTAPHYQHSEIGYNYRMSNICAGIGRGQLTALNVRISQKKRIYEEYRKGFQDLEYFRIPGVFPKNEPNYWLSVGLISDKSKVSPLDIINRLGENNVESRPVWKPMHLQPVFAECDFFTDKGISGLDAKDKVAGRDKDSVSAKIFNCGVCLPSDTKMTLEEQIGIINIIRKLFGKKEL